MSARNRPDRPVGFNPNVPDPEKTASDLSQPQLGARTARTSELTLLPYKAARSNVLEDFEREYVTQLLSNARGNVALAARRAQMDRTYLIKLIHRHGLRPREYVLSSVDDSLRITSDISPDSERI